MCRGGRQGDGAPLGGGAPREGRTPRREVPQEEALVPQGKAGGLWNCINLYLFY